MLAGSLVERRVLSVVPEGPVMVWRGSLAGDPGTGACEPAVQIRLRVEAPGERRCRVDRWSGGFMETIVERPAALDVHKASVMACVRVPAAGGGRDEHVEEFATTVRGLLTLADWLEAHGVTQVAMEATGVYWKPVWAVLEDRFACMLVNARHVRQVALV